MENKIIGDWKDALIVDASKRKRDPIITFSKGGGVRLNPAFIEQEKLENKNYVIVRLLKQNEKTIVGLEFLDERKNPCLKLSHVEENTSAYFSGMGTLAQIGINTKTWKTKSFTPKKQEFEGKTIYYIEIEKTLF